MSSPRLSKWWILIKSGIFFWIVAFIYLKIKDRESFIDEFYQHFENLTLANSFWLITAVAVLIPFNWLLEARKWQFLARKKQPVTLAEAYTGVLSGLALAFVTPHALGDYVGRIGQMRSRGRTELVGSILLGRVAQLIVTLLFGILGVTFFLTDRSISTSYVAIAGLGFITLCVGIIVLLRSTPQLLAQVPIVRRASKYLRIIADYSYKDLAIVVWLSAGRYLIFTLQFFLVLLAFQFTIPTLRLIGGITWIFLIKSIVPSFNFLSDLGIRELSALQFFEHYAVESPKIIAASLFLWAANLLLPAMVGSFFVFKLRLLSKK